MKITHIDVHRVVAPVRPGTVHSAAYHDTTDPSAWSGVDFDQQYKFIYEVHTNEGIVGLGESYRGIDERLVQANCKALIGQNAMKLNWRALPLPYNRAYDGFECAVLDLMGKKLGVPVYQLLGGACRDKVQVDFWCGRQSPEDLRTRMQQAVQLGYHGIKMKYCWGDPHRERAMAVEAVGGKDFAMIFDPNMRCHTAANAVKMAHDLDGFNVTCLEDPIPRWNIEGFRLLRQKIQIPIAFHTHLPYGQTLAEMFACVKQDAADFYNLSGSVAGVLQMAALAQAAGCPVWHGSEVDLGILEAAYLHTCAAMPNCTLPSDLFGELIRVDDFITQPHEFRRDKDGVYLRVPQGTGLGVELDRQSLARFTGDPL
ncbi:MAG: muconate lactonizing mandelate racemase [Acidimicrobiia bacterium]|nr:muconate lactonizing mandelate racemase [Acidimicrobiia bacterium]